MEYVSCTTGVLKECDTLVGPIHIRAIAHHMLNVLNIKSNTYRYLHEGQDDIESCVLRVIQAYEIRVNWRVPT